MASQYVVQRNADGGWDLFMRDLVSLGEYSARFQHLVGDCGWAPDIAAFELYHMVAAFVKKTESKTATFAMCERYIFDTIDPGDIIQINSHYFVVNRPAAA
jgi:hypothetical protein